MSTKYKIKSFFSYFKSCKFLGVTGTLSQELAEVSSMLHMLRLVRTDNREDNHNDVLTDAGTTFSDIDLCIM